MPRTSFGAVLMWVLTSLWYVLFAGLAVLAAVALPSVPMTTLRFALPISLLGIFLYAQIIPLITLSTGWALQINKLQVYPIRDNALFGLEVLLRVTSAPEILIVLLGGTAGLARRPDVPVFASLCLLLFIPFNLFLQLAVRNFVMHAFERNRFREIITIAFVSIGVLPQLVMRTGLGLKLKPYFILFANGNGTPWHSCAALGLGQFSWLNFGVLAGWTALAVVLARRQFARGLVQDDAFRTGGMAAKASEKETGSGLLDSIGNLFQDPTAALVQKELRSILRMPRFRVALGMACIFSVVLFLPMIMRDRGLGSGVIGQNLLPMTNLYALLILSDALLLNIFGTDRSSAQLYFLAPVPLATVFKAKNLVACVFILLVNVVVAGVTFLFVRLPPIIIFAGFLASATAAIHLMWAGNLLSVMNPRPADPSSTMRKQGSAKIQLWILLCTIGMAVLVGFAYLARWALDSDWALLGVLAFELVIGYVIYRVSLDSAVARGLAERERIIDALSKTTSPIGGSVA